MSSGDVLSYIFIAHIGFPIVCSKEEFLKVDWAEKTVLFVIMGWGTEEVLQWILAGVSEESEVNPPGGLTEQSLLAADFKVSVQDRGRNQTEKYLEEKESEGEETLALTC